MASWGYCSHNGPSTWANNFPKAGGTRQSPIDIKPSEAKRDENLVKNPLEMTHSADAAGTFTNTGHSVMLSYKFDGSSLTGGPLSEKYQIAQFHFHWGKDNDSGSEHTVDGKMYAAEVHLVHVNTEKYKTLEEAVAQPDGLCVLGAFLKPGKEHAGLKKLTDQFKDIKTKGKSCNPGPFDPSCLLPENKTNYWSYLGSLTTPPCLECVTWVVFQEPIEVSEEQLAAFRSLQTVEDGSEPADNDELKGQMIENYRPPISLGDRELRASF